MAIDMVEIGNIENRYGVKAVNAIKDRLETMTQ